MTAMDRGKIQSVCAVIVTYNPDEILEQSLATVAPQVERVIIVDNRSSDARLAEIKNTVSTYDNIELILNEDNYGPAYAFNQGIDYALDRGFDWVLILDDDSVLRDGSVKTMLQAHHLHAGGKKIGILAPRYLYRDRGNPAGQERNPDGSRTSHEELTYRDELIASGSLIPRYIFEDAGKFEASYFIEYFDIEFFLRARQQGYQPVRVRGATLHHSLGKVVKRRILGLYTLVCTMSESPVRWYYKSRNRVLTYRKYLLIFPGWVIYDLYRFFREIVKIIIVGPQRRILLGYVFKGITDGVRGKRGLLQKNLTRSM